MSSFSSPTVKQPDPPKTLGMQPQKTASHERAIFLPYFCGTRRLGIHWLADVIDDRAEEVTEEQQSGGKGGDSEEVTTGYDYFATVAGVFCLGPVDAIKEVYIDDEKVWEGEVERDGDDFTEITLEERGAMRLYWGTSTQDADAKLTDHPAYRGQCYAVFEDLYFGRDRTTAPNVEVVLRRAPLLPLSITELGMIGDSDANPIHVIVELLTNKRFGLGLSSSTLDAAQINAAAATVHGEGIAVSPLIDEPEDARALLQRACEYFDGFVIASANNLLQVKLARDPGDPEQYPLLGEYDLTELPRMESEPWTQVINEVSLRFTDRKQAYDGDSELWKDEAATLATNGEPIRTNLDRPWFCRRDVAARYAARYGRLNSVPLLKAKISVRKISAIAIHPGDFVRLTYQDWLTTVVMRVVSKTVPEDRAQSVVLELVSDKYVDAITEYTPDDPPIVESELITPSPLVFSRVIELPHPMAPNRPPGAIFLAAVAARASKYETTLNVFASDPDEPGYSLAKSTTAFARYGTLAVDYDKTGVLDESTDGILLNIDGADTIWPSTTRRRWLRNEILLFIGDEILSYQTATVVSASQVRLTKIKRGLNDTPVVDYVAGENVLAIRHKHLRPFTMEWLARGDVWDFKLSPATALASIPLADLDPVSVEVSGLNLRPCTPINLRINGDGTNPHYASGEDLTIRWDITDWGKGDEFYERWDNPKEDPHIKQFVVILTAGGTVQRRVRLGTGVDSYTYTNATLVADFGSEPASLKVRVFHRRRGRKSRSYVEKTVSLAVSYTATPGLYDVRRAIDPATIMDRNWTVINAHWGLSLPATSSVEPEDAPAAVQANFATIAAAQGLTLLNANSNLSPRDYCQANIDTIRDAW